MLVSCHVRSAMLSYVHIMQGGLQATAAQKHGSPSQVAAGAHAQSLVEPESRSSEEMRALKVGQQLLAEEEEQLAQAAAKSQKQRSKKQKQKAKKQQQQLDLQHQVEQQQHEQLQQQEEPEQQQGGMPCASQQDATQLFPQSWPTEQTQLLLPGTGRILPGVAEGVADLPSSCDTADGRMHRLLCCPITQVTVSAVL